jgi:hypothetical protein
VVKPTEEQVKILTAVRAKPRVMIIEAGAGAGKTTTLKLLEDALEGLGQYTAFNSSLVTESKSKFRKAKCNTMHSLAFQAFGKRYAHRLNSNRVRAYEVATRLGIEAMCLKGAGIDSAGKVCDKYLEAGFLAAQVMGAIRRFCSSADKEIGQSHFKYIDGIDQPDETGQRTYTNNNLVVEYLLPFAEKYWADIVSEQGTLPFNHGHYLKMWELSKPVISTDYLLVDEGQDLSPVMLSIIEQQTCMVIIVGDSNQEIYEWMGAVNSLKRFPDAPRLWLTQSFRFGSAIADVANAILATLVKPTPLRLRGFEQITSRIEPLENPRAILYRTNAAATARFLNEFGKGKKPHLIGGGGEVLEFVRGARELQQGRPTTHPDLACFSTWKEVEEYAKSDEGEELRLLARLIKEFGCDAIIQGLERMPEERDSDMVICTAHKSKGREWDTVQLGQDFPLNKPDPDNPGVARVADDAERRLLYVAATRAKKILDKSQCPFFTGKEGLSIVNTLPEGKPILPETPATPPPANVEFTWARGDGGKWLIRGPKGHEHSTVEVVRQNGTKSRERIGIVVKSFGTTVLYGR